MQTKQEKTQESYIHKPVMLNEAIDLLNVQADKIYVDCTLGLGGHSENILKKLNNEGLLIGIEQDKEIFQLADKRLKHFKNCCLFNCNYLEISSVLKALNIEKITGGIIADLGANSLHFSKSTRGFSFQSEGPLDMRMDQNNLITAEKIINSYNYNDLADLFYQYGNERYSRKIARTIIKNRPVRSTIQLARLISYCYPKSKKLKIHPATRVFQALRIKVNNELDNLEKLLCFIPELLQGGSRLIFISFHSLEDRIVKMNLKTSKDYKILTKKPLQPSEEEIHENPSSRSAKLRAAQKI